MVVSHRCEICERAYCEDHLPAGYTMVGECEHFKVSAVRSAPTHSTCEV